MSEAPAEVVELAEQRSLARAAKDYAASDALRDEIAALGWTVTDASDGTFRLSAAGIPIADAVGAVRAADVVSLLDQPTDADVSVHWVVQGWPEDVIRAIDAFRAHTGDRSVRFVVADVTRAAR